MKSISAQNPLNFLLYSSFWLYCYSIIYACIWFFSSSGRKTTLFFSKPPSFSGKLNELLALYHNITCKDKD